jgi:hypothetical protein
LQRAFVLLTCTHNSEAVIKALLYRSAFSRASDSLRTVNFSKPRHCVACYPRSFFQGKACEIQSATMASRDDLGSSHEFFSTQRWLYSACGRVQPLRKMHFCCWLHHGGLASSGNHES